MEPKLSDFGLAKLMGMQESKVFTDVRGTIGYMDPEYMTNAKLTCASDIYSFGIVMLQVLSGQRVIDLDLDARDQLTRKVIIYVPFLSRRFELYQASKLLTYICVCVQAKDVSIGKRPLIDIQDRRMKGEVNSLDLESILQIAVLCAANSSTGRPTIDLVFDELERAWSNTQARLVIYIKLLTKKS